jgi:NhaP-type Na+/H+ or K+/H+ antiporter
MHDNLFQLVFIFVLGAAAQWLSWRLRIPAILTLLISGLLAGPVLGYIDPNALFGELLFPLVSLAVAVILYEGGLDLQLSELRNKKGTIISLVSIGCLVNCLLVTALAYYLLGLNFHISLLVGGVLSVSGPTVVQPLLRFIRPKEPVHTILKWEGILIDPIGAVLAVLILEEILLDAHSQSYTAVFAGLAGTLIVGSAIGFVFGKFFIFIARRRTLPEELYNTCSLACLFAALHLANLCYKEAGLVSVTILGVVVGNSRHAAIRNIVSFKENLRVLLISALFIILAARVNLEHLQVGFGEVFFLAGIIFIARPIAVFVSTAFQGLSFQERLFLSWMFPRGIVAAAVASLFAIELQRENIPGGDQVVTIVFLVILATVVLYGLTGSAVARWLGVSVEKPRHYLFVGINRFSISLAEVLQQHGVSFTLVDTNVEKVVGVRLFNFPSMQENLLTREGIEHVDVGLVDRAFVVTSNLEANSLLQKRLADILGHGRSYLTIPQEMTTSRETLDPEADRQIFPSSKYSLNELIDLLQRGSLIQSFTVPESFSLTEFEEVYAPAEYLFLIREERLFPCLGSPDGLQQGDVLIFLSGETEDSEKDN